jgi:hypothetical protein
MKAEWTSVRVRRETLARLRSEIAKQTDQYVHGRPALVDLEDRGVSLDTMINALLDQVDAHRKRAKKQSTTNRVEPLGISDGPAAAG